MSTEQTAHSESETRSDANGASTKQQPHTRGFARRAKDFVFEEVPERLEEQLKRHPYRLLAVAGAIGLGAGVVFSSRILRAVVASAASAAVVELGRTYLMHEVKAVLARTRPQDATGA